MTGGRGFIALAALIFGKWRPWPAFGGALLFGFADALGTRVQIFNVSIGAFPIPSQFLQLLPYVVTLIVLAGAIGTASPPAADGRPYQRVRDARAIGWDAAAARGRRGVRPAVRSPTPTCGSAGPRPSTTAVPLTGVQRRERVLRARRCAPSAGSYGAARFGRGPPGRGACASTAGSPRTLRTMPRDGAGGRWRRQLDTSTRGPLDELLPDASAPSHLARAARRAVGMDVIDLILLKRDGGVLTRRADRLVHPGVHSTERSPTSRLRHSRWRSSSRVGHGAGDVDGR